ncbi:MAG: tape measure protein [Pseudomonadota bacterium]
MTIDIATLAIRIDSLEARNAVRDMDRMSQAGARAEQSTAGLEAASRKLQGALAFLGIGAGVAAIIQMSDQYAKFTAQLRLATQSQREYAAAYDDVKRIANAAQQDLASTGVLYARIANGTRELGVQQKQVAAITETVNMALKVSGATAVESASAQLQLSQAFASGTLRGEEFNAVNEAAPRLMKALADGIGVPVGALKEMASNGLITSKIMADVLPKALSDLREEAKQVQTISGAFAVLKNNMMEFTAIHAQANGMVALLTGGIGLLANNLSALIAVTTTMTALQVNAWLTAWIAKTYEKIAASQAQAAADAQALAASIAAAEADVARTAASVEQATVTKAAILISREEAVSRLAQAQANITAANAAIAASTAAGAQSFAMRTLRLATAELAVAEAARAAMVAELALLGQQQARVSAQITAATAAQTVAQDALNAANGAGAATTGLLGRAVGMLGGPISAIITVLGLAATAWAIWGDKGAEAEKKVTATLAEEIDEYLANLDKQIAKLKERNELAQKKMTTGVEPATEGDKKREAILTEINRIAKDTDMDIGTKTAVLSVWGGKLNALTVEMEKFGDVQKKNNELTRDTRLVKWFGEHGTAAQRMAAEIVKLKKEFGTLPQEMMDRLHEKFMGKSDAKDESAAHAADKARLGASLENIKTGLETEKAMRGEGLAAIAELNRQGLASDAQVYAAKYAAALAAGQDVAKIKDAEVDDLVKYNNKDLAEEIATQGKIDKLLAEKKEALRASLVAAAQLRTAYEYDRNKPARDAETATNKEVATIYQQIDAVEKQIEAYGKLPATITEATIAQLEAEKATVSMFEDSEQAVAGIDRKIEAYKRLSAAQAKLSALDTGSDTTKAKELLDILTAIDNATRSAAAGMEASFGRVGKAIGSLTTALSGYAVQQQAIAAQLAAVKADPKNGPEKIAAAEIAASRASAQAQIKSYGDMAGAAKGFFKENTTGYKVLEATEKGFRAVEMALAVKNMLEKSGLLAAFTGLFVASKATEGAIDTAATGRSVINSGIRAAADGVAAFAKTLASIPFPFNVAAGAGVLALLAAAGVKVMGGGGGSGAGASAAEVQKKQGTGTVLGDDTAKSDSIKRGIELLAKNSSIELSHTAGMLSALKAIEASMVGLTNIVVRTTGVVNGTNLGIATGQLNKGQATDIVASIGTEMTKGLFGPIIGGAMAKTLNNIWGKVTQNIVDAGVQFGGSVRELQNGKGYEQYASVDTTTSSFFGLKKNTNNSVQTQALSDELTNQFGLIFKNMEVALGGAATSLGLSTDRVTKVFDDLSLAETKVSLKGLKGDDLTAALNAVVSKALDDMSSAVFPEFEQFRGVGEGYAETVLRVTTNYANLDSILASVGATFGATGISSLKARKDFLALVGGIDALAAQTSSFADNYLTEAERLAPVQKYVTEQLTALGYASLKTRDDFKAAALDLVNSGALATDTGAKTYAGLMAVEGAFAKVTAAAEDTTLSVQAVADQRKDLQKQIDALTLTPVQQTQKERDTTIDKSNYDLFDSLQAEKDRKQTIADTTTVLGIQAQMYSALKDDIGAAVILEKQHEIALKDMTPEIAKANTELWAVEKAEKARTAALASQNTILGYQAQIAEATKDKQMAADVAMAQFKLSLVGLSDEAVVWATKANDAKIATKNHNDQVATSNSILGYQSQIAEATGNKTMAATVAQAQYLATLAELPDTLQPWYTAAYKAQTAQKLANDKTAEHNSLLGYQQAMYTSMGDKVKAAAVAEEQFQASIVDLTPKLKAAATAAHDADVAAKAKADSDSIASTLLDLQMQQYVASNSLIGQATVLEKQRNMQLAAADPLLRDQMKLTWQAQDYAKVLADKQQETNSILDAQAQMYTALNDKAGLAYVTEQQHKIALMEMTPALAAATAAMWKAQAAEQARADRLADSNALLDVQAQRYAATGNKAAAAAVVELQHAAALALMTPAVAAASKAVWDLITRLDGLKQAANDAFAVLNKAVDLAKADAKSALDAQITILNAQKTSARALIDAQITAAEDAQKIEEDKNAKIKALAGSLKSTLDSMQLNADSAGSRIAAQAQISAALAQAKATGVLPDSDAIAGALKTVATQNMNLFSSRADFERDYYKTALEVSDLNDLTAGQLTKSTSAVDLAKEQIETLKKNATASDKHYEELIKGAQDAYDLQVTQWDATMKMAQDQLDAMNGTTIAVKSVADALAAFQVSVGTATAAVTTARGADPTVTSILAGGTSGGGTGVVPGVTAPSTAAVANPTDWIWQASAGSSNVQAALAVLQAGDNFKAANRVAAQISGITSGELSAAQDLYFRSKASDLPAFAGGGLASGWALVGEEGPEVVNFDRPGQVYTASQTRGMFGGDNGELRAEIAQLRVEVSGLLKRIAVSTGATATSSSKAADMFEQVTEGGAHMRTKEDA